MLKDDNVNNVNKIKITSFESTDCGTFGDVLGKRPSNGRFKIGMLGLGYFEYWRMYPKLKEIVKKDLEGVYQKLTESLDDFKIIYPGIVDTLDRAEEAGAEFAQEQIDLLIIVEGTYIPDFITIHAINRCGTNPQLILFNSQTGYDISPDDDYVATMRNSALIGISQLTGSFNKMNLDYDVVIGEINDPHAYREIKIIAQAYRSVKRLKNNTYGLIGHVFRGMYDLEFDTAKVKGFLGPEVMTIQAEQLVALWEEVKVKEVDREAEKLFKRFKYKKINLDDVKRSCRVGLAMQRMINKFQLDGLCFLGQHYIENMTGAPARMGASLMMEQAHTMVACEGDIGGLVMMQLLYDFTGNIPFQAEWGQLDRENNALFLLGHGIASPELGFNPTLTCSPEEWGFKGSGLNYEMIMKPGKVTMGHFLNAGDNWQMLISEGEAIDFPCLPCDEIHAMIGLESPVEEYMKKVLEKGVAHHLIVAHGSVVEGLKKAAKFMRIEYEVIK
jgi:L-arabinose isomerase